MKTVLFVVMLSLAIGKPVCCTPITTDAKAYLSGGAVMVPMRAIFEWLGADVTYDGNGVITAKRGESTVVLHPGQTDALVNDVAQPMGAAANILRGTTYIPLRFVSESMGAKVEWNAENKQVSVIDNERVGTIQVTEASDSARPANTRVYAGNDRIAAGKWVGQSLNLSFSFYVDKDGTALVPSKLLGGYAFRLDDGEGTIGSKKRIAIRRAHGKQLRHGFSFAGETAMGRLLLAGDFTSPTAWAGKFSLADRNGLLSMKLSASWSGSSK
jgi:hypothetical protein